MPIRNPDFYTLNATRPYPLDDGATLVSDLGERLPHHILADMNLRFPNTAGNVAMLGAVTVNERLVTLLILAADEPAQVGSCYETSGDADRRVPLAAITLPQPVIVGRHYPLDALLPGVGGWVVFGAGVQESYQGRFSTPQQAMLTSKVSRRYNPLPLTSVGKAGEIAELTGIVQLRGGNDMELVAATREIDGQDREVIVIRLVNTTTQVDRNVLDVYRGPCGRRPESQTCEDPAPVETLNNVVPDCCGAITLNVKGCAQVSVSADRTSAVLDCDLGMIDVCSPSQLPDADGNLPGTYPDQCA